MRRLMLLRQAVAGGVLLATLTTGAGATTTATRGDAATVFSTVAVETLGPVDGAALPDAPADSPAGVLHALGVVQGRSDGTFGGDAPLSRAQLASLASRLLAVLQQAEPDASTPPFEDAVDHPHAAGIAAAAAAGLVLGHTDGTFGPNEVASTAQLASVETRLREALGGDPMPDPVLARFDTPDGSFAVILDDPSAINRVAGAEPGTHVGIPNGQILPGDGGVNTGHSWHLVDVEIVDIAMEVCDGSANYIDEVGLDSWYETQGDRYCPWGAIYLGSEPVGS